MCGSGAYVAQTGSTYIFTYTDESRSSFCDLVSVCVCVCAEQSGTRNPARALDRWFALALRCETNLWASTIYTILPHKSNCARVYLISLFFPTKLLLMWVCLRAHSISPGGLCDRSKAFRL